MAYDWVNQVPLKVEFGLKQSVFIFFKSCFFSEIKSSIAIAFLNFFSLIFLLVIKRKYGPVFSDRAYGRQQKNPQYSVKAVQSVFISGLEGSVNMCPS